MLRAVAAAQLGDEPAAELEAAYAFLLDVRDELRRRTGRPADVLVRQEQRPVADALGLDDEDALLREVSLAGRRLAFVADETWRRVEAALVRRPRGRYRRVRREPLADGVVRQGDEVVLARDAKPAADPGLLLRAAAAAARADLLLSPYTLKVLAVHSPPMPEPWPAEVRWSFLRLLASGRAAVPVLEQLRPGGAAVPADPRVGPRALAAAAPPWHRFTVDRHLVEAAAAAAELTHDVDRPDLLLVGRAAARHRQGLARRPQRGRRADRGRDRRADGLLARRTSRRSAVLVRHHLLLPATATRRDIDDPATIDRVADDDRARPRRPPAAARPRPGRRRGHQRVGVVAVEGAPGRGAGRPGAGEARREPPMPEPEPVLHPTEPQVDRGGTAGDAVGIADVADGQQVTIGAPDRPGLLSICAGVLALNQLDVRAAKMSVEGGYGTGVFAVRPRFGRAPVPEILADGVRAALEGTLPLAERLRQREADYRQDGARSAPPRISWHNGEVSGAATGIVEVRAGDRAGLLYRLTAAIAGEGLDVTSARIETLGADAVDSFYVCNPSGSPVDPEQRAAGRRRAGRRATRGRDVGAGGHRHAGLAPRFCQWGVRPSGDRDGTVPPVGEESLRGQPLVALPAV